MTFLVLILGLAILAGLSQMVAPPQFFASIEESMPKTAPKNQRVFVGNGSGLLPVPGLQRLIAVRVGELDIPLTEVRQVLASTAENVPTVPQETPLVRLVNTTHGPALQRGLCSNDGIWQAGATISVIGDWADGKTTAAPPVVKEPAASTEEKPKTEEGEKKPDSLAEFTTVEDLRKHLDRMNVDPLRALGTDLGLTLAEGATKKEVIAAIATLKFPEAGN